MSKIEPAGAIARPSARRGWRALPIAALTLLGAAALAPAPAAAETRCIASAFTARGLELPDTRAAAVRGSEGRACQAALRRCERLLDDLRYESGRPLPYAECDVVRAAYFGRSTPRHHGYYSDDELDFGPPTRGSCNFRACEQRYRSFRHSDCSFQPYDGPRRACTL